MQDGLAHVQPLWQKWHNKALRIVLILSKNGSINVLITESWSTFPSLPDSLCPIISQTLLHYNPPESVDAANRPTLNIYINQNCSILLLELYLKIQ